MNIDQLAGKSLKEVLLEIDGDSLVYLGANSSFFDIATAHKMRQKGYIETLSLELQRFAEQKAEAYKTRFPNALKNPPAWKGSKEDEDEQESIDKYISKMESWPKRLKTMRQAMKDASDYAKSFVKLEERIVKSVYQRIDGTGVCVIVEGNEVGGYWFLYEKECGKGRLAQDDVAQSTYPANEI